MKMRIFIFVACLLLLPFGPVFSQDDIGKKDTVSVLFQLESQITDENVNARNLSIRVGDSTANRFKPELEITAWNGECSFKIDLRTDTSRTITESITPPVEQDLNSRIEGQQDSVFSFEIYLRDDGNLEWEIVLACLPDTNVFAFKYEATGLTFAYQDTLTDDEKLWAERPDSVVGSYAVFHSDARNNWKDSTGDWHVYQTGKAFHIYRPKAVDSAGKEIWCDLRIADGEFKVTVDKKWLKNASYPVSIDPTIGYTTLGGSNNAATDYHHYINWVLTTTTGSGSWSLDSAYLGGRSTSSANGYGWINIWEKGSTVETTTHHLTCDTITIDQSDNTARWYGKSQSGSLSGSTTYITSVSAIANGSTTRHMFDTNTWGDSRLLEDTDATPPSNLTGAFTGSYRYSCYVVYSAGSAPTSSPIRRRRIIQKNMVF